MPRLPEVGLFEESSEIDLDDVDGMTPAPQPIPRAPVAPQPPLPPSRSISQRLPLPPGRRTPGGAVPAPPPRHEQPTQPGLRGPRTPPPRPANYRPEPRRPLTQDREA